MAEEFDSLVAQLRSFFSISFNEDGTLQGLDLGLTQLPIGLGPLPWPSATPPAGWLLCRGDAISRITYKSLFEVIGTTYGAGDGSTTFNLPDMQQKFPLGKAAAGTGATLGASGGAIDHTHSGGSHTHTISSDGTHIHNIPTSGTHTHDLAALTTSITNNSSIFNIEVLEDLDGGSFAATSVHEHYTSETTQTSDADGDHDHSGEVDADGLHDHGGATGASSGTTGAANPPFISLNFIILAGV